ncbi:MAG: hypothetical protein R3327_06745 [Nitrosopumilaceae archaeon]|nr:hypothetical protein [Nitrosopumilaceae archaeon]
MDKEITNKKTIVLRSRVNEEQVLEFANKKKTSLFGNVFSRPKPEEVEISSVELFYEPYWMISGSYSADYYRKNAYEVETDSNVTEAIIGKGTFPVTTESGTWSKLKDSFKGGDKRNKLNIPVEEHVLLNIEEKVFLNSAGSEIKFPYKLDSDNLENFPEDVLKANESNIRSTSVNDDEAVKFLIDILQQDSEENVRMIKEKIIVDNFFEIFVPIYEARCVASNNKVEVLRIDAIDLKAL